MCNFEMTMRQIIFVGLLSLSFNVLTIAVPLADDDLSYDKPLSDEYGRIVGGKNVSNGGAPHQIALLRDGTFICGGSLVGPQTVLTAAQCVYGYENRPTLFQVRYGSLDRTNGTILNITKITRHPSYSSANDDYDIATLTLNSTYKPGTNSLVISLATIVPAVNSLVNVTGWGRLSSGGTVPALLQQADTLRVVSKVDCQNRWGNGTSITDRMLCAHSTTQAICNQDTGGPLTQNGLLVGVTSWAASSCLHATYPNVFANVTNLRSWILSNS